METRVSPQQSAICNGGTPPREMPANRDSSPANRLNGSDSTNARPKASRTAVAPSKARAAALDSNTTLDPHPIAVARSSSAGPQQSTALVAEGLRPRQVAALGLLVSGMRGREVAATVGIAPETLSRWKAEPEFKNAMRQLMREHIASMQLSMIVLASEAITQLRCLVNTFSDEVSLKACAVALSRAAPLITAMGQELRQSVTERPAP